MDPEILDLLLALDGVAQSPRYHPEGDALFHSLQVFEHARRETDDHDLWCAALLHDVGKGHPDDDTGHDELGADLLEGLVNDRVVFLVRHHLDLLRAPRSARRRHAARDLRDLERLRRWDLAGRAPHAHVPSPHAAFALLDHHGRSLRSS